MQLQGAQVTVTDPWAIDNARKKWPDLAFAADGRAGARGCGAGAGATEWPEYVGLDPAIAAKHVAEPRIIDGRNCLDPVTWREAGWTYRALGRP